MQQKPVSKKIPVRHLRMIIVMSILVTIVAGFTSSLTGATKMEPGLKEDITSADSAASVAAFMKVYDVLVSPRCMNCHPAGDIPLQGDDSHLHSMSPKRGKDGKGLFAMKCSNCHQPTNAPGIGAPPGNPNWALPPADMKMIFQGRTARQLALQLMDYNQNGHKNKAQLIAHARDTLVKAGWNMGEGRKPPPLPYKEFVATWDEWIKKGGIAPQ